MYVISMKTAGRMRMPTAAAICLQLLLMWLTRTGYYNAALAAQQPTPESMIMHLDASDLLKNHPACAEFLLPALQAHYEAQKEADYPKGQSPRSCTGMWLPKPEAYDPDLKPPGKWLQEATFSCAADHFASFGVEEVVATEEDLGSNLRLVSGDLSLIGFWDRLVTADVYSPCQLDENLESSNFVLRGASVSTRFERRICMLGCGTRPPTNFSIPASSHLLLCPAADRASYVNDCGLMVKMKLPTAQNLQNRFAEGEMTSTHPVEDAMYFPPVSIFGQIPSPYQFAPEETLEPSTLINKFVDHVINVGSSNSLLLSKYLAEYLKPLYFLEAEMPISVKEEQLYMTHQLLRLGPFNAYPVNHPKEILQSDSRLVKIGIHLKLQDILCQPSMEKPGHVLISGYIGGQVDIHQTQRNGTPIINSVEQKPLAVEGTWNSVSKEIHMVGCVPTNFSPLLLPSTTLGRSRCNWKLHLKSVLQKTVTKDTPEGAVLSSIHETSEHPEHFPPLRFASARGTAGTFITTDGTKFNEYRYTNLSQAVMLASKNRASFPAEHGLTFPAPDKACCSMFHYDLHFRVASISLVVTDENACPSQTDSSSRWPCSGEKVSFKPEEYLRVAVRFAIWPGARLPFALVLPHRGEGIYQPYTGQMHLVTNLQPQGVEDELGDDQVYVKICYPATNSKETRQKMRFTMESLRSPSDPLYFTPLHYEESTAEDLMYLLPGHPEGDISSAHMVAFLIQSALLFSTFRQMLHNVDTGFVSQTMLGFQSLCQLALSFSLSSRFPSDLQGMDMITNGLMALAIAMLLLYLICRVQKARVELKVTILRWYCSTATRHDPPNFPANEFLTSSIASALILILATSIHHATTYSSLTLVQDFYLLPQVIANILCDVHGRPLSPSFILMPTFVRAVTILVNAVFPDQNFPENAVISSWSSSVLLGRAACVCALATIILVQQRFSGRSVVPFFKKLAGKCST